MKLIYLYSLFYFSTCTGITSVSILKLEKMHLSQMTVTADAHTSQWPLLMAGFSDLVVPFVRASYHHEHNHSNWNNLFNTIWMNLVVRKEITEDKDRVRLEWMARQRDSKWWNALPRSSSWWSKAQRQAEDAEVSFGQKSNRGCDYYLHCWCIFFICEVMCACVCVCYSVIHRNERRRGLKTDTPYQSFCTSIVSNQLHFISITVVRIIT